MGGEDAGHDPLPKIAPGVPHILFPLLSVAEGFAGSPFLQLEAMEPSLVSIMRSIEDAFLVGDESVPAHQPPHVRIVGVLSIGVMVPALHVSKSSSPLFERDRSDTTLAGYDVASSARSHTKNPFAEIVLESENESRASTLASDTYVVLIVYGERFRSSNH